MDQPTQLEARLTAAVHARLDRAPDGGLAGALVEFGVFVAKQAWACAFGAAMLVAVVVVRTWYPADLWLTRNDLLTLVAVGIQVVMLVFRLESGRELWVIMLFHLVGTAMEVFKTAAGSWSYETTGILRIGAVPLFSGFMYAAVGSYMVRVHRLFDLTFSRYPPRWLTVIVAAAIYANFFTHHWMADLRWPLTAAVLVLWGPTMMQARAWRRTVRMPLVGVFVGVAGFIWIAENICTWAGAWLYPSQQASWHLVSWSKLSSWFLLMIISVVLVTLVHRPRVTPARVAVALASADGGPRHDRLAHSARLVGEPQGSGEVA